MRHSSAAPFNLRCSRRKHADAKIAEVAGSSGQHHFQTEMEITEKRRNGIFVSKAMKCAGV
jgi:hypothetical protein